MLCVSASLAVKRMTMFAVSVTPAASSAAWSIVWLRPAQPAVGVVASDLGPGARAAVAVDLYEQAIVAVVVGQVQVVVVADRDLAAGHIDRRRGQAYGAIVDVGVAGFVLGQVALAAAVGVRLGVVVPGRVIDRHAALPVPAAGAEVHGGPTLIGLEVVAHDNRERPDLCGVGVARWRRRAR